MEPETATSVVFADDVPSASARVSGPTRVSLVVPTLNEASRLPLLLDSLDRQTRQPDEFIVADAHSTDDTRALALAHGARVVDGGMPGPGRNAGAAVATGDIIVFLDADAEPEPDLLEKAIAEFEHRELGVATAPLRPSTGETIEIDFWCLVAEWYIRLMQHISPHAVGLFIVVRRDVHESIGGFDETVVLAEDHEYVRRASQVGKFGVLRDVRVRTSMRRIHHEGRIKVARIFFYTEYRTLRHIPIRSIPFDYDFGAFVPDTQLFTLSAAIRRWWRMISKPSTQLQTDALFAGLVSIIAGVIGTPLLALTGLGAGAAAIFAVAAASMTALNAWVALHKLRYEYHYGPFFMVSVGVSDVDIYDNDGRLVVRKGVDEVAELHTIGSLDRMAELNRQGTLGLLTIARETLEGVRGLIEDISNPRYADVRYVTGYSNLTSTLFKMGFGEIDEPPKLDPINRWYKPIMTRHLSKKMGKDLNGEVDDYRMAIATKQFVATELSPVVEAQLARVRRNIERAERLGRVTPAAEHAVEAILEPEPGSAK
jgi:glycosyltransferase involved in cell wall biosynthesis